MNNPLIFLLYHFAKKNNIVFDKEEAKVQLLSHPYFPSINSITDLFNFFNIENYALRVEKNLNIYSKIPESFMAQIGEGKSSQLVLVSKKEGAVELIYNENNSQKISVGEFLDLWSGILVVIEKPEKTESNQLQVIFSKIKRLAYLSTFLTLIGFFIFAQPSFFELTYFALSCTGIFVSYLILRRELGLHSKILEKFCSGDRENSNCDVILNSKGSTILKLVKLSDIGLIYFASLTLISFLTTTFNLNSLAVIFVVSSLAIPFTIYSVFYQWKIVKSWCALCLTISGILWLQFGTLFLGSDSAKFNLDTSYIILLASFLTTISLWIFIKPLLLKNQLFKKLEIAHIKFKRNFRLFHASLNLNPVLDTEISSAEELIFGNKISGALLNIIVITNPLCGYCKESHRVVERILNKKNENIQIIIRFNVQAENEEALGTQIAARILELYYTTGENKCLNALSDIFSDMDATSWLEKWGRTSSKKCYNTLINEKEWCSNNKINFTPDLLLNGQRYPKDYEKMDLLYFIDDIIEEQAIIENA